MSSNTTLKGEIIEICSEDGAGTAITVYRQVKSNLDATIICNPAMGVPAGYYLPLVSALYDSGLNVITSDLRGLGLSKVRASRATNFGFHEIISYDFKAVIDTVRHQFPGQRIFLLGHSLGGQLSCLYASLNPGSIAGIILIASCSLYYKGWPFPQSVGILIFEQFSNIVAQLFGYYPGRLLRFGGQEARRLIRDWSYQGLTGRYEVAASPYNFESLLGEMRLPVLSISFEDDRYVPRGAVRHLLEKMRAARVTDLTLKPSDLDLNKLGHFGWVKNAASISPYIINWMNQ
jgi:predicted alpha/beta hydrolase